MVPLHNGHLSTMAIHFFWKKPGYSAQESFVHNSQSTVYNVKKKVGNNPVVLFAKLFQCKNFFLNILYFWVDCSQSPILQ